ncbi:MAG: GNAT family protein [Pseudomonadota bacterium]
MTTLHICSPDLADAEQLLEFECANRAHFEQWVQARDPAYYSIEAVRRAIQDAQADRDKDVAYQYLVKMGNGSIVGRVNFTAVVRPYFNKAVIGYRMAQGVSGRGYASQAVGLALQEAFGALDLWRVEAVARPENAGSIRVLERNGFVQYGLAKRSMLFHGVRYDLAHFERHAQPA